MSYETTSAIFITDIDAFERACRVFNLTIDHDNNTYQAHETQRCDARITWDGHPGAYQMGLVRANQNSDGSLEKNASGNGWGISYDTWRNGNGMVNHVGQESCGLLMQEYGLIVAAEQALANGYGVERIQLADGYQQLSLTAPM